MGSKAWNMVLMNINQNKYKYTKKWHPEYCSWVIIAEGYISKQVSTWAHLKECFPKNTRKLWRVCKTKPSAFLLNKLGLYMSTIKIVNLMMSFLNLIKCLLLQRVWLKFTEPSLKKTGRKLPLNCSTHSLEFKQKLIF